MRPLRSYVCASVAVFAAAVLALSSCSRKAEPIPRGTLAKIYAEMFLLDQQVAQQRPVLGRLPDTTIVYQAVLEKYGYSWENYLASQEKYIRDPERYSRILKKAVAILTAQQKTLEKEKKFLDEIINAKRRLSAYAPNRIYLMDTLSPEFSFNFDFQQGLDTVFAGPRLIIAADSILLKSDSLSLCSDSLK